MLSLIPLPENNGHTVNLGPCIIWWHTEYRQGWRLRGSIGVHLELLPPFSNWLQLEGDNQMEPVE